VIDVVLALGYAGRRRDLARNIGRAGDGGIDAVTALDELGLDAIYLQAKRVETRQQRFSTASAGFQRQP